MSADLLAPIVAATEKVMLTMAQTRATAGSPTLERPPGEAVSASIAFSGDIAGWLCLGFSEPGILSVVGNMFGEAPARIDDDVVDSTGELVNIICGEARRALSEQGLNITAGIPQTARGAQEPPQGAAAFVPFDTPDGALFLAVAVEGWTPEALVSPGAGTGEQASIWQPLELSCALHGQPKRFTAHGIQRQGRKAKPDLFLLPHVTDPAGGLPPVQYIAQEVFVCPGCLFASSEADYFAVDSAAFGPLHASRETVSGRMKGKRLKGTLREIINQPARSVELAYTAYQLAIQSAEALLLTGHRAFAPERRRLPEYALRTALMHKARGDGEQEKRVLQYALKVLSKRLPALKGLAALQALYRIGAVEVYLGRDAEGSQRLQKLIARGSAQAKAAASPKEAAAVKRLLVQAKQLWDGRTEVRWSASPGRPDYAYFL